MALGAGTGMEPAEAGWLRPCSGAALLVAAVRFLGFLLRQLSNNGHPPWGRLILAAGMWMLVWAGVTFVLRCRAAAVGPGAFGESMRQLLMELAIFASR